VDTDTSPASDPATVEKPPIPFVVIGGYLGSGKTTLLNRVLRNTQGLRAAVLVNDFGSVNIDAELVEGRDGDTISLTNGCICCSLALGFAQALPPLLERDPPLDHVVVEASGVADPWKVGQFGTYPGFRLDGVIVVADAETVRQRAADPRMGRQALAQLKAADILVLNKTDLVDAAMLRDVRAWLADTVPGVRIVDAVNGAVPAELLLGAADTQAPRPHDAGGDHGHPFETVAWEGAAPLDRAAFEAFVAALPADVIRAKGILRLADAPERRTVFQLAGKRWSLRPGAPWGEQAPGTRLVLIGLPGSVAGLAGRLDAMAGR